MQRRVVPSCQGEAMQRVVPSCRGNVMQRVIATGKSSVMQPRLLPLLLCLAVLAHRADAHSHDEMVGVPAPNNLGTVAFEISCKRSVRADFDRGVALLHSFWIPIARETFEHVAAADPACAMAYWGEAMADLHQLFNSPNDSDIARGQEALRRADAAAEASPRERAYIGALHGFFDDYASVRTPAQHLARAKRYADAMETLSAAYPDDVEAQIFHALALLYSDPPDDVGLVNPRRAVAILSPLLQRFPDHPGIAHYLIHSCDNPHMAQEGLAAARRYAQIAPAAPHALHMPAHIYARLGLWEDDIRSNLASKAASEAARGPRVGAENRLHAMEFLEYAYLQIGHEGEARAIVNEARTVKAADVDPQVGDYYSQVEARYPALLAIETHDWAGAARLQPPSGGAWYVQAATLLARSMAAAHMHDAPLAREAAAAIDALVPQNVPELQRGGAAAGRIDEIHAWSAFTQGDLEGALGLLRAVADRQAQVGKGEVELPAREMLAEMELLSGRAEEALRDYQASLASDPNRYNGLLGAAEAAEKLGRTSVAAGYYRTLLQNCAGANGAAVLPVLAHARQVLAARS
jgi:tetratricopeptide (TPR) repeat protein